MAAACRAGTNVIDECGGAAGWLVAHGVAPAALVRHGARLLNAAYVPAI